jgi:hypothetical protein
MVKRTILAVGCVFSETKGGLHDSSVGFQSNMPEETAISLEEKSKELYSNFLPKYSTKKRKREKL